MNLPLALFLVFEVKHLVCDFFLQTEYHLGKFKREGWEVPLASHCAVHALATLLICLAVCPRVAFFCVLMDFGMHFIMDRVKADPELLGRFKPLTASDYVHYKQVVDTYELMGAPDAPQAVDSRTRLAHNKYFWWCLGVDQFVHQLTSLAIIGVLVCQR